MPPQTISAGDSGGNEQNGFRMQLPLLSLLTAIFFINFLSRIVLAPLLPSVEAELSLSHSEAGSFFMLISIGYFVTLLCSGYISSRLTHKRTIICSNITLGITLICLSFSTGLWPMRLGLVLMGMAAGPYIPSGIAVLTTTIASRHWGKALSIHELAPNLSFALAPFISEIFLHWFFLALYIPGARYYGAVAGGCIRPFWSWRRLQGAGRWIYRLSWHFIETRFLGIDGLVLSRGQRDSRYLYHAFSVPGIFTRHGKTLGQYCFGLIARSGATHDIVRRMGDGSIRGEGGFAGGVFADGADDHFDGAGVDILGDPGRFSSAAYRGMFFFRPAWRPCLCCAMPMNEI